MGMISGVLRAMFVRGGVSELARAGTGVIDAVRPNATQQMQLGHDAFAAAQAGFAAEFQHAPNGRFDAFVNGLNRLPRPMLALGTLGLFVYAMADPAGFAVRMRGLAEVPDPLWWLLGAVVAFYFGARETHHLRAYRAASPRGATPIDPLAAAPTPTTNAALADWFARGEDTSVGRG